MTEANDGSPAPGVGDGAPIGSGGVPPAPSQTSATVPARAPPAPRLGTVSMMFPNMDKAEGFISGFLNNIKGAHPQDGRFGFLMPGGRTDLSGLDLFGSFVSHHGGEIIRSSHRREQLVYQYQDHIWLWDRRYLSLRDPTARMVVEQAARDTWNGLPRSFTQAAFDQFIGELSRLGFTQSITGADIAARRDGAAFLYINASGNPDSPLQPTDVIFGFDFITMDQVPGKDSVHWDPDGRDPILIQHRIQRLEFYQTPDARNEGKLSSVHGSRIVLLKEDLQRRWWFGSSALDCVYDDIWNYRDVIFAQKHSQFVGNPIKVDVDVENGFDIGDDEADEVQMRIRELRSGSRDSIVPIMGLTVTRLGAPELDDPEPVIRALVSRISNGTGIPANMLLASSRGSQQVTDEDYVSWESEVQRRRNTYAYPLLAHMWNVFRHVGLVARRPVFPGPMEVRWPHLRVLNEREEALAVGNQAKTLLAARQAGFIPPAWFMEGFTENTVPINPDLLLPRKTITESIQPEGADEESQENQASLEEAVALVSRKKSTPKWLARWLGLPQEPSHE